MKTLITMVSALFLSVALLAGCGGSSSSSSNTKPAATITITSSNADSVAKGAMSSKDTSSTGTDSASTLKAAGLVTDPAKKISALSLALEHLKKAESLPFPGSSTTRAVAGWPIKIDCATGGAAATNQTTNMITYDIVDADNSTTLNNGDTFSVTYASCTLPTTTIVLDGGTSLTLNAYSPATTLNGPSSASITLGYTNFTITDTAPTPDVTAGLNGSMTLSFSFDGTTLTASMSGTSFTASHSEVGSVTYSNFAFTASANATVETFAVDLTLSMTPTGGTTGTINISTPVTFSGPLGGNPTSGQMRIDGANGSYITITAKSDGSGVDIVIFDGTNTTTTTRTWDQL